MNVFKDLSRYGRLEPENYLTESFVFILRLLFARSSTIGIDFLSSLINIDLTSIVESPSPPKFATQEHIEQGIPDITISIDSDLLAYIEVKHDAPLGPGQLEYYKKLLSMSEARSKALVLLTRSQYSAVETELSKDEFHHVCWYEVHSWLRKLVAENEILEYFINDFLTFLEEKNMSLQRIKWEFESGVGSLIDLTTMLEAGIGELLNNLKIKRTAGWSWRGFYLDDTYFLGIRYENAVVISFEDNLGTNPDLKMDLDLKSEHFFSLDSGEQFECILNFINRVKKELKFS